LAVGTGNDGTVQTRILAEAPIVAGARLGETSAVDAQSEVPDAALRRARIEAANYIKLMEALERSAHAEEDTADRLLDLGMSTAADEHLERAAELYQDAADAAQKAIDVRIRESDLMREESGGNVEPQQ
jgi:hypothetical protein